MKTKVILFAILALMLGCVRETENNFSYTDEKISLHATIGDGNTKTILQQGGRVFWSPGDVINVFYGDLPGKFTSNNTEPAATAIFIGTLPSIKYDGKTEFVASYPYSETTTISGNNTLEINLPSEQTAVEGTFADDLFICVAKSKDYNLHFYNVCGGVKFSFDREDVKKVVFKGNGSEPLAGRLSVVFDTDDLPKVVSIAESCSSVALNAPNGGTFNKGVWYFIVLAPQLLDKGYTMEFYGDELLKWKM